MSAAPRSTRWRRRLDPGEPGVCRRWPPGGPMRCGRGSGAIRPATARRRRHRARLSAEAAAPRWCSAARAHRPAASDSPPAPAGRRVPSRSAQLATIQNRPYTKEAGFEARHVRQSTMNDRVAATLTVIAEHVERYRQHLADVGPLAVSAERDDLRAAIGEAEQGLRNAERLLRRALEVTLLTPRSLRGSRRRTRQRPRRTGPSLCNARRRIPASPANQVAGTWLVGPLYTDSKTVQGATEGDNRAIFVTVGAVPGTTDRCPPGHIRRTMDAWRCTRGA